MSDLDIKSVVAQQYGAALAMLGKAIELCPETLWGSEDPLNRYWHIAYHALFYTHLYLQATEKEFKAWPEHRQDYQYLGPRPWAPQEAHRAETAYSKAEIMEYHRFCCSEVEAKASALDLAAPSGFDWLPFNKLTLQFYSIRHIQHHTGQLAERLRTSANIGLPWIR